MKDFLITISNTDGENKNKCAITQEGLQDLFNILDIYLSKDPRPESLNTLHSLLWIYSD